MIPMALIGRDGETAGETAEEFLARLFDAHQGRLYRLARRLSGEAEEARDLVQEAFLRAARKPRAVPREDGAAEAWLVKVLVHLARDRFRRLEVRRLHQQRLPDFLTPSREAPDPEQAAVARATVAAALAELPPRRRATVVLAELEGLSTREIARLLGITQVTVRWHLAAGRKELARRLLPGAPRPEETSS